MADCQSCGMPMDATTNSQHDVKYCIYCQDQETKRLKSFEEVKEGSIQALMRFQSLSHEEAEIQAQGLKDLPRWQREQEETLLKDGANAFRTDTKPPEDFGKPDPVSE